jgi:phenylpropionate dioxygenase-like ring-hydroxylating dioxygenase large terminal subunit
MAAEWKNVLAATELCPGDVRELSHQGVDLLIFRTDSGVLRAMAAQCPHMGNYIPNGLPAGEDLSRLLQGEELVCPFHNWRFDGLGYCTGIPSGQRVPAKVSNGERIGKSWPVREIDGVIQIELA